VFGVGFVRLINTLQGICDLFALACVKEWAKIRIQDDLLY
jgi:hypothetical protein